MTPFINSAVVAPEARPVEAAVPAGIETATFAMG
jgi:hypothetical protein